jgi:predicted anti-sigma-YlaC factor YlaD
MSKVRRLVVAAALLAALGSAGCSLRTTALNAVADALSGTGDVFASDEDPELVRDAIPFGLKTYESILAELPEHRGLLLAAASGFTQYAYAFVVLEADRTEDADLKRARELRVRARKLFLRGRDYALRGLDAAHPGFSRRLRENPAAALSEADREDLGLLYWAGASWGAALMVGKEDLGLVADLPLAGALVARVLALDDTYGAGAAHEFMISYEGSRSEAMGGSPRRAREHYRRAMELSGGRRASVPLALAESVSVREQNLAEFRSLCAAAKAVDPDAVPSQRLVNILAHRRAVFLESRIAELFVDSEPEERKK